MSYRDRVETLKTTWPVILGLILAAGHLHDELWHDEIVTLVNFASDGILGALTDYHVPNNHILFSALLALWNDALGLTHADVVTMRVLPLLMFGATVALTVRVGGMTAGLFLAGSHVALNWSCQLRGYGLGMLCAALMMTGWAGLVERRDRRSLIVYVLGASAAVGVLPTNIILHVVLGGSLVHLLRGRDRRLAAMVALLPALGALFYVGVIDDFVRFLEEGRHYNYHLTVGSILGEWTLGLLRDAFPLVALAALGSATRPWRILGIWLVLAVPAFLWMMPSLPVTRTLIPFFPVAMILLARSAPVPLEAIARRRGWALAAVIAWSGWVALREHDPHRWHPGYETINRDDNFDSGYDNIEGIYSLYYHNAFSPSATYASIRQLSAETMTMTFFDSSDPIALRHLAGTTRNHWTKDGMYAYHYQYVVDTDQLPWRLKGVPVLLVTARERGAHEILERLKLPLPAGGLGDPAADHGFYKIYRFQPFP